MTEETMRALTWHGEKDIRVSEVPRPEIVEPTDAIVEITATAICGSDLHLYNDRMPGMREGDVLGHEPMGEVIEVGDEVESLEPGDRVVVPFTISCGSCWFCEEDLYSLCDNSNPNAEMARKMMGQSPAGLFGYSHLLGGYAGGQAEYLRVPYADVGPITIESDVSDEEVLFLSDVFPTGYMDIDDWERVWRREKRRQSVQVEDHDCPHDSVSCFADDLCVQCQIDNVRDEY